MLQIKKNRLDALSLFKQFLSECENKSYSFGYSRFYDFDTDDFDNDYDNFYDDYDDEFLKEFKSHKKRKSSFDSKNTKDSDYDDIDFMLIDEKDIYFYPDINDTTIVERFSSLEELSIRLSKIEIAYPTKSTEILMANNIIFCTVIEVATESGYVEKQLVASNTFSKLMNEINLD